MTTSKKVTKKRGRPKGHVPESSGEWKPVFLSALAMLPNIRAACRKAGVSRAAVYKARAEDMTFADEWAKSLQDGIDAIEATLMARAMKSDTTASIFLLKNLRPEVYGENFNVNVSGSLSVEEIKTAQESLDAKINQIAKTVAPGSRLVSQ
jgi:hypothetical protein